MTSRPWFLLSATLALAACGGPVGPPGSFWAVSRGATMVHLAWVSGTDATGIEIDRAGGGEDFASLVAVPGDATEYTDTGLSPDTAYRYRARAARLLDRSPYTGVAEVVTDAVVLPAAPTHRIIIEEATGTWCGYCPDGAYRLGQVMDAHPGLVFGASFHQGDDLQILDYPLFEAAVGGIGEFPTGAVNRDARNRGEVFTSRSAWGSLASLILAEPAGCGVGVETALRDDTILITVLVAFSEAPVLPVRLTVYLTEDGIGGYPQASVYDNDGYSPFYGRGNPIADYVHDHVVRRFLTAPVGDAVVDGSAEPGRVYVLDYRDVLSAGWDAGAMSVVALVSVVGATTAESPVLNTRAVEVGDSVPMD